MPEPPSSALAPPPTPSHSAPAAPAIPIPSPVQSVPDSLMQRRVRSHPRTVPIDIPRLYGRMRLISSPRGFPVRYPSVKPLLNTCARDRDSSPDTKYSDGSFMYRSIKPRYIRVTQATYSGRLRRPSILNESIPASISSGRIRLVFRSRGLKRYSPSVFTSRPRGRVRNRYRFRHGWAQTPLFPLRPPIMLLMRHCPEYEMQSAPCTNISISRSVFCPTCLISSSVISLASTTLVTPISCRNRAPSLLCTVIWVLAWIGRSGASDRAIESSPTSCTITASAPDSSRWRSRSAASLVSLSFTSVFTATYALTPRRCA